MDMYLQIDEILILSLVCRYVIIRLGNFQCLILNLYTVSVKSENSIF